ncbi:hypothetical protein C6P45_004203 [Maudiozyma exigua]|uniref:non-specific serine/threonine protein kinase n=1 Tax=Maudiozyma exigua TaxID=34358 RepID=A0A9P7BAK3_MAUEX|nr:hypothetical protein C6P45_004203 [Kazachstania exigua]
MSRTTTTKSPTRQKRKHVTFGPYLIGATLGEGEFGKVKMGWTRPAKGSHEVSRQVAIKLIRRTSIAQNSEREIKVYREINALKHLTHPNIIELEEVLQNSKYVGIVLEYASGGEFYKFIQKKRRLDEQRACKIFSELISGVSYMHSKGLVHRDLKLENLLLDTNENLLITDFGFVNEFHRDNELMKTSCGSPCYAAPELVVTTKPYMGRKADIWSCGIILFAMLAGYLPWDDDVANPKGDDIPKLYHYITRTKLKFPGYISAIPRDLLRKILVPDPKKRIAMHDLIRHPWLKQYHEMLCISSKEWDVIMLQKKHNGKLKRNSTVVASRSNTPTSNKNDNKLDVIRERYKQRATSLIVNSSYKSSIATQHTYQREILGDHSFRESKKLDPVMEEEKTKRRSSAASAALRAMVESEEHEMVTDNKNSNPLDTEQSISSNIIQLSSEKYDHLPLTTDLDPVFDITNHTENGQQKIGNIASLNGKENDAKHFSTPQAHHRKPRPATYHLTLHSTTADSSVPPPADQIERDISRQSLVSNTRRSRRSSSLIPDDVTALTSYSKLNITHPVEETHIPRLDSYVANTPASSPAKNIRMRPSTLSDHSSGNESYSTPRNDVTSTRENSADLNERVPLRAPMNHSSEDKSKKRFSFLSFYSSFNSSRTTMETDETSSTSVLSHGNHQPSIIQNRNRSGTEISSHRKTASTISSSKINGSQRAKANKNNITKKENSPPVDSRSSRPNRASLMVSSLPKQEHSQSRKENNRDSYAPIREVSRTRKVLDFFKRRSMRL